MGFATIVALLALLIAFVALWLVSDILKKVESQNERFVRAHIASVREDMRDLDKQIVKMGKRVDKTESEFDGVDKRFNDHAKDLEALRGYVAKVAEDLDLLDRSIPSRFRARVVQPKDAETPEAKPKPTVQ